MGKKLIDVLDEEEQKTFITERVIPKLQKLLNMIRSSEYGRYESDVRDNDYNFIQGLIKDMEVRVKRKQSKVTVTDLHMCNELYKKYK